MRAQSERAPVKRYWYARPNRRMKPESVSGWKIMALEATWRCCATESARRCRASTLSSSETAGLVVRSGTESRGLGSVAGTVVDSEGSGFEGRGEGGGREPMEEVIVVGRKSGVLVTEGGVESDSRIRFARKVVKKAVRDGLSELFCTFSILFA